MKMVFIFCLLDYLFFYTSLTVCSDTTLRCKESVAQLVFNEIFETHLNLLEIQFCTTKIIDDIMSMSTRLKLKKDHFTKWQRESLGFRLINGLFNLKQQ